MKSLRSILILAVSAIALVYGCQKSTLGPLSYNPNPPGVVSNIDVVNQPGQVTLTYKLPADQDLSYVKAVYTLASGAQREVKSSFYTNTLVVDGFGDTQEHDVQVFAVNKSEVASAPVTIKVKPLENPIWSVFRSLQVAADFAGMNIKALNPTKGSVAIIPMRRNKSGDWAPMEGIYSSTDSINRDIRGLDTVAIDIAVIVRDRFLNHTDTLFKKIKPLYETMLAKPYATMTPVVLPGDQRADYAAGGYGTASSLAKMWDGVFPAWPSAAATTPSIIDVPHSITFDLKVPAQLSRIVIIDFPEPVSGKQLYYYRGDMKKFEIWGSANPNPDGSWDSWTKLGTYEQKKPSGKPYGDQTEEDRVLAAAGFSWKFRIDVPKMRYLRIKCNENWMGTKFLMISEVFVYGDPR